MGQKGREILQVDPQAVIDALRAAYADEWLAHYYYLLSAQIAEGLDAPQVSAMLISRANDELGHAQRLAERLLELDGVLPTDWADIPKLANCVTFTLPRDPTDVTGILHAVLTAERCAIDVYQAMLKLTLHKDPVTYELAQALLADEVEDEEETERLLGKAPAAMAPEAAAAL